ncbi:MAG: twin-arginine translocase subunit TatC [Deltaproteobacteria bacterium]|nr:twin-arginine translocase subunit TatC [Deltaproteobacteria bacterium]
MEHLEELRRRLIISLAAWGIGFLICYAFAETLFRFIAAPVRAALPAGSSLVFISATEPFFAYLKIAAFAGLLAALPVILWQAWLFVAPGLYVDEKRLAVPFVLSGCLCFGLGAYFGFTHVFPVIFTFLIGFGTGAGEINAMLSMGAYLSLSLRLLLSFGLIFELPVAIFFLARLGLVDHRWLAAKRKFAIVLAFVVGAILTPPDVFSQVAIALPFILLYEVGIVVARLFGKKPGPAAE